MRGRGRGREGLLLKGGQTWAQLTGIYLLYSSVYIILANPLPPFVVFSQSIKCIIVRSNNGTRVFSLSLFQPIRDDDIPSFFLPFHRFGRGGRGERDSIGVRVIISINLFFFFSEHFIGLDVNEENPRGLSGDSVREPLSPHLILLFLSSYSNRKTCVYCALLLHSLLLRSVPPRSQPLYLLQL